MAAKSSTAALYKRWWIVLPVVCLLATGGYVSFVRAQSQAGKGRPPGGFSFPVSAVQAKTSDMSVYLTALGTVVPLNTVTVKTRVDGELMSVGFQEGQAVGKGHLLAQIDPRPFEVQLTQAQGQMGRDQALLQNARVDLQRYKELWEQNSISKQQLDTQEALVGQYEGAVKTDQGQIDNAKLQLTYCRIISPLAGRAGLRLVDPGNIIHASDANGLVVITQVHPISVVFAIPEDSLPQVLAKLKGGGRLAVEAYDREQKVKLAEGHLLTLDNQIDPNTGTVKLKALFANQGDELYPNQFVNARLRLEVLRGVVVAPAAALQRGAQGTYLFVVKPDQTVQVRQVVIGETNQGEAVINSGLAAGELVVVEGADRLREGAKVEVKGGGGASAGKDGSTGPREGK